MSKPIPIKVIFLDVDGVVATRDEWTDPGRIEHQKAGLLGRYPWNKRAVRELNRILKETGAMIVLCSAWRIGKTFVHLDRLLLQNGVNINHFLGATPYTGCQHGDDCTRFDEVKEWLRTTEAAGHFTVTNWIILDDEDDYPGIEPNRFIKTFSVDDPTDWASSRLQSYHADDAIRILNS